MKNYILVGLIAVLAFAILVIAVTYHNQQLCAQKGGVYLRNALGTFSCVKAEIIK